MVVDLYTSFLVSDVSLGSEKGLSRLSLVRLGGGLSVVVPYI